MEKGETSFKPIKAVQTVASMVLLPFIDLTRQCGLTCCCGLDIPGIEASNTNATMLEEVDEDDDDDDDDSEDDGVDAECEV